MSHDTNGFAKTPKPPYYVVAFTNQRSAADEAGYQAMAQLVHDALAGKQEAP